LITIDDILPLVRGNVGRFSLIMALSVFLLFNPWMNAGKTFYYVLSFVINGGPVLIIFFVVTVLLVIITTMFSVLSTKYKEESGNIQFSEKYVFLIGIMVFLILFERFF